MTSVRSEQERARAPRRVRAGWLVVLALFAHVGCGGCGGLTSDAPREGLGADATRCPAMLDAPSPLPGMRAEHLRLTYWLPLLERQTGALDAPLLDDASLRALDAHIARSGHRFDLREAPGAAFTERVAERFAQLREKIARGALFDEGGDPLDARFAEHLDASRLVLVSPSLHRAHRAFDLRCTPSAAPYYSDARDHRFDRNQCSRIEAGEPVQVLGRLGEHLLVRTGATYGFIAGAGALGPSLDEDMGARALARADETPLLTRRALLEEAFRHIGTPYGWGGQDGGLDCSSFVMNVLARFGLHLPRHSADQAESGAFTIELPADMPEATREHLLDEANRAGVVLAHFPGHIMLYLGRDDGGRAMAIHAFAEYVERCERADDEGRDETLFRAPGVTVTHLDFGRGTSRRAFIERFTRLAVMGRPTPALMPYVGAEHGARPVEARACRTEDTPAIIRSPRRPHAGGELRLFYADPRAQGEPLSIALVSASGARVELPVERRGGPPFGYVARWPRAEAGTYTVLVGEGPSLRACETLVVEPERSPFVRPVRSARNAWDEHTELLYALFVEKLFDYPLADRTWPSLDVLLAEPEKNILFDHFTANEESRMRLAPDCADLPAFLRAYFAWKLGLPFGYRSCSRGRSGTPPSCGPLESSLTFEGDERDHVRDFVSFLNGPVRGAVHSASGRTVPRDEHTDLYPVALTREALRPGTVYADPYGHIMTIVRFEPQTDERYGVLVAVDAQPDATIGMPRFWRGTFLFTPDTREVGAGFKAFRPVFRVGRDRLRAMSNAELAQSTRFVPYATEQYEGTTDDFYERVEAIIDPRPLDPFAKLEALADALHDSVTRRVVSVDNAQRFLETRGAVVIPMPSGAQIFLTSGPWEDYSTPSRDLRLLIALDAVTGFPDRVARQPERYGVRDAERDATIERLRARLDEALRARRFDYRGSDGRTITLTLDDVRARARGFELAYNPNDCPELRWAAPEGSAERAACRRRAPEAQRAAMRQYRAWFARRERPAM